jgi:NAD(P)-dependent dehydrogenase (short-subunit alcohol dehydrogenase family)
LGPAFLPLEADVTDQASLDAAVAQAVERFGPIDGVVANAGRGCDGELSELSADDLLSVYDCNVAGVHRTLLACLPHVSKRCHFTAVSSVAAFLPIPRMGAYCATKHALEAWASAARVELAHRGLRICTCCPWTVATDFFDVAPKPGAVWDWRPGKALAPEAVARVLVRQVERGSPRRRRLPWFAAVVGMLAQRCPRLVEWVMGSALAKMRAH